MSSIPPGFQKQPQPRGMLIRGGADLGLPATHGKHEEMHMKHYTTRDSQSVNSRQRTIRRSQPDLSYQQSKNEELQELRQANRERRR